MSSGGVSSVYRFTRLEKQGRGPLADKLSKTCDTLAKLGKSGKEAAQMLLITGEDIQHFTPATLYQSLDPARVALDVEREHLRFAQILTVIRNIMILCPLIFTWWALSWATTQYQADLIRYPDDLYQPFLKLWEGGFHTSNSFWAFSNVAIFDVGFFLGLITVGFFADMIVRRARARGNKARESLADAVKDLSEVALNLMRGVNQNTNPAQWASHVHQVLEETDELIRRVENHIQQVVQGMAALQTTTDALVKGADKVVQGASSLVTVVQGVQGSASQIATSANEMKGQVIELRKSQDQSNGLLQKVIGSIETVATNTNRSADAITSALGNFEQQLTTTRQTMNTAASTVEAVATQLTTVTLPVQEIVNTATSLKDQTQKLQESQDQSNGLLQTMIDKVEKIVANTVRAADGITDTIANFHQHLAQAHQKIESTKGGFDKVSQEAQVAALTIKQQVESFTRQSQATGQKMDEVVTQLDTATEVLQSIGGKKKHRGFPFFWRSK